MRLFNSIELGSVLVFIIAPCLTMLLMIMNTMSIYALITRESYREITMERDKYELINMSLDLYFLFFLFLII